MSKSQIAVISFYYRLEHQCHSSLSLSLAPRRLLNPTIYLSIYLRLYLSFYLYTIHHRREICQPTNSLDLDLRKKKNESSLQILVLQLVL